MSSPSRLLRGRPTAPLPTQYASNSLNSLHRSEIPEETSGSPAFLSGGANSSTHHPSSCCTSVDLDVLSSADRIKRYLRSHDSLLEEIILEDVPQETLERILVRKSEKNKSILAQDRLRSEVLNDIYKHVTKLVLETQGHIDCNRVLQSFNDAVIKLVNASRSSLFVLDSEGKNLHAHVFGVSEEEQEFVTLDHIEQTCFGDDVLNQFERKVISYKQQNIAFSIDKGVAGHTAKTGKPQNVADVKSCPFFCTEVDALTGYTTKTLLCVPLISGEKVIGVLEAVNKTEGVFSEADEKCLQTLADFVSLIMCKCQTRETLFAAENQLKVAQEMLAHHRKCSDEHLQQVKSMPLSADEKHLIQNQSIKTSGLSSDVKVQLALTMLNDLVGVASFQFDQDRLLRFMLTVAKNYRSEEYHNWDHAFTVAHCMYWLLKGAPDRFTDLERISLFFACLCHDLDHRGHNNSFLVKTGAPLAKLYPSSVLENHHFNQTLSLLQLEDLNIFSCLSSDQYKQLLSIVQKAILATDLVLFFSNREKLSKIIESGKFNWDVTEHRELAFSLMMTTSDLSTSYKPWEDHRQGVHALFREFHNQGDEEKALGIKPLEMMDKNFEHTLPSCQVGFLRNITCPCCELLATILPPVTGLLQSAQNNLAMWEKMAKESNTE